MAQPELAKSLPHSLDAERAILGAILLDNTALAAATEKLTPADFFKPANSYHGPHQILFTAMIEMRDAGTAIDLLTLTDYLENKNTLESAGGAAYISQLMDGVPRIVNVAHYAGIVKEHSKRRVIIHSMAALQERALQGATSHDLAEDLDTLSKISMNGNGRRKLHPAALGDALMLDLKPATFVMYPILPDQGLGMLYAPRGRGKTFVALEMGLCVAIGAAKCFSWSVPQARPVLYVDGEMPANRMQERLRALMLGHGMHKLPVDPNFFRIITPDLEERGVSPNISDREGQNMIEEHLTGNELLILDNLSALCRTGKENEGEAWVPVAEWALRLRQRGVSVIFVHHAGKGGEQRGTSRREDLLDCIIAMKTGSEYHASEGLRCEVHIEKLRNSGPDEAVYPFELTMQTYENGAIVWTQRPLTEVIEQTAYKLFAEDMSIRDVAEDLHISKRRAHTLFRKFRSGAGTKIPD